MLSSLLAYLRFSYMLFGSSLILYYAWFPPLVLILSALAFTALHFSSPLHLSYIIIFSYIICSSLISATMIFLSVCLFSSLWYSIIFSCLTCSYRLFSSLLSDLFSLYHYMFSLLSSICSLVYYLFSLLSSLFSLICSLLLYCVPFSFSSILLYSVCMYSLIFYDISSYVIKCLLLLSSLVLSYPLLCYRLSSSLLFVCSDIVVFSYLRFLVCLCCRPSLLCSSNVLLSLSMLLCYIIFPHMLFSPVLYPLLFFHMRL